MKSVIIILLTASLLLFAGCFDYEESLVINEDGSGTLEMHYAMDKAYLKQMEQMTENAAQQFGSDEESAKIETNEMFNKEEITNALKLGESGITLISYEVSETDKSKNWDMKFSFKDINKLYYLYYAVFPDEDEDSTFTDEAPPTIYAKQDDGTWLFQRINPDDDAQEDDYKSPDMESYSNESQGTGDATDVQSLKDIDFGDMDMEGLGESLKIFAEGMQSMMEQIGEHKLRFTVKFPGNVVESNATSTDGNTVVWEFKLNEISEKSLSLRAVIKP